MRRWALVVLSIAVCGGCDYVFRLDELAEPPSEAPAVVTGTSVTNNCTSCDKVTLDAKIKSAAGHTLLLVSVSASFSGTVAAPAVASVMLGKDSFAFVERAVAQDGSMPNIEQWLLVDPPAVDGTIEVTLTSKVDQLVAGVFEIEGASDDPLRSTNSVGGSARGKAADNTLDSAELDLVVDTICAGTSIDRPGPDQTPVFVANVTAQFTCGNLGTSTSPGAPTVLVHWDINALLDDHWIDIATSIRPAR